MPVKNAYPNLPVVPYKKTTVAMSEVERAIADMPALKEVKRAVYVIFRIESANGKSGVCQNYIGLQAESKWDEETNQRIIATCVTPENSTGKQRRFACFYSWQDSIGILTKRLQARGIYIGGYASKIAKMDVKTPSDLALVYRREWVEGKQTATASLRFISDFLSMYKQAQALFP